MYIRVFPQIGGFPPKWMVKITENPLKKVDELGGKTHYFWKHLIIPKDAGVFLRKRFSRSQSYSGKWDFSTISLLLDLEGV